LKPVEPLDELVNLIARLIALKHLKGHTQNKPPEPHPTLKAATTKSRIDGDDQPPPSSS
jgi:hypothetical protein